MKVLYDHQAFTYQNWGGVSKCFCELLTHRPNDLDFEIAIKESNNVHLKESGLCGNLHPLSRNLHSFSQKHSILGREKIYNLLSNTRILHTAEYANKKESIRKLKEGNFDVFHPTYFDDYFLPFLNGKPYVLTVHDLMPELFGWWKGDPQIANKPRLLKHASAIITVSENTKLDLCKMYEVSPDKVYVIYHGFPEISNQIYHKDIINAPYFLYVGRRGGYKNSIQTIKDFGLFHKQHKEVKFVFTGPDFTQEEIILLKDSGLFNNTIHIFATDDELASLYTHTLAFVFPSLYEGFGMPILEAFSYGCPVLLNNKSCFPEIGGEAAIYFDSVDGNSNLSSVLEDVYQFSETERIKISNKELNRLKDFSWQKSAELLTYIYTNLN